MSDVIVKEAMSILDSMLTEESAGKSKILGIASRIKSTVNTLKSRLDDMPKWIPDKGDINWTVYRTMYNELNKIDAQLNKDFTELMKELNQLSGRM